MSSRVGVAAAIVKLPTPGAGVSCAVGRGASLSCLARGGSCGESDRATAEETGKTAAIDALKFTKLLRVASEEINVSRTAAPPAAMTANSSFDETDAVRFCLKGGR